VDAGGDPVIGIRAGSVLAIAGVIAVYLGTTGWSNRDAGLVASTTPSAIVGEQLGASPYSGDSFLIWPGTPSAAASRAARGLTITVTRSGGGVNVVVSARGHSDGSRFYPAGARVYVISGGPGNQSLVVTDSDGRIVA
jgi:hypothetical protein